VITCHRLICVAQNKFAGQILLCAIQADRWLSHVGALSDAIRHRALVIIPPSQLLTITTHHHIPITPPTQWLAVTTHHHIQLLRAQSLFSVALALWFRPQPPDHSKYWHPLSSVHLYHTWLSPLSRLCSRALGIELATTRGFCYHQLNLSFQFIVDHLWKPGCKLYGSSCVGVIHVVGMTNMYVQSCNCAYSVWGNHGSWNTETRNRMWNGAKKGQGSPM